MTLEMNVDIPAHPKDEVLRLTLEIPREVPDASAWANPLKGRAKALGSKLTLDAFMEMQEADKRLES